MITIVTVWLCLITHVACDVIITVNNNGSDYDTCCVNGTCPCSSLSSALHNVSDNTVINITSESVTLHDIVGMGSGNLNNITITGNSATIMCNNIGGVYCESCSDITIMGITWYQCGRTDSIHPITQIPALNFTNVLSKIVIQDCTFLNSSGCPVYIQNARGSILITKNHFITNIFDSSYSNVDASCAGVYVSSYTKIALTISKTRFYGNGCTQMTSEGVCVYFGVVIKSGIDVFDYNYILFENVTFSDNSQGLYLDTGIENTVMDILNVNIYNTDYGIYIITNGDNNDSISTVRISSATFMGNIQGSITADNVIVSSTTFVNSDLTITAGNINVSSATFIDDADALRITAGSNVDVLSVNISNCTFNNTLNAISRLSLKVSSSANLTLITVSDSYFCNNQDGAIRIQTHPTVQKCTASIVFTNVTIYNTTGSTFANSSVYIENINTIFYIIFKNVNFLSNHFLMDHGGILLINNQFADWYSIQPVTVQLIDCIFHKNTASDHVLALNVLINVKQSSHQVVIYDFNVTLTLSNSSFDDNFGAKSIAYVNIPTVVDAFYFASISTILDHSTFSNNKGTALYLIIPEFQLEGNTQFINNSAANGAAVYLKEVHTVSFDDNANVQFSNNFAEQRGGAMYFNLSVDYCDVFKDISNTSNVSFSSNSAGMAGNSIYFSIPQGCKIITNTSNISSLLYIPNKFNYFQPRYIKGSPVVTSPHGISLHPPAAVVLNSSSNSYALQQSKMLGEPIQFTASVLDYFSYVTEPVVFSVNCETCGDDYVLSTYEQIVIHDHTINEFEVFPRAQNDVTNKMNITITLLSFWSPIYKYINASLSIELSSCHTGYLFDKYKSLPQCVCYPYPDVVHCTEQYVEIKTGYWIGLLGKHHTLSVCPNSYCNFAKRTETSEGYYDVPTEPDDQCSSHRTGVACGECKSGYTLAYDSPGCIITDKSCSVGMTVLVIVLTILYWITIVSGVFCLMYARFKIPLGYVYAIIYYYSIVDVLLINDVSEGTSWLLSILSSFAKLTPQLFGQLCLVEGLSGIDQQFIHYSHALAVALILLIIVLAARRSGRLTRFVGPCIIRVICLLLLLSYTSLASTSLQLLRPLKFDEVTEVRTYSSPDIKYFTGRHLAYAIVAILFEVIIVIGLPLFLLLEPVLSRLSQKVNFIRFKPLLDEFQNSYKDKYRWFAAYYLICRQVIFLIVYVGNGDYYKMLFYLLIACIIIAMIHMCFQPYKNNVLNALDGVILLVLVVVVNLNTFSFLPSASSTVLVILPLLLLVCFVVINKLLTHCCKRRNRILHLFNPAESFNENEENDDYDNQRR